MVLAPKLDGNVAYEQPVQQPNAMSAIAGLFNFGVSTLQKTGDAPKPTEDEKFALAVKEFEENKGATFTWNRQSTREFIFNHPEHTDKIKPYVESFGVVTADPEQVAETSAIDWFSTSEGQIAVAAAKDLPPEDRDAFLAEQVTTVKKQEAEIAKLTRNSTQLELEGTLQTKQWDAIKPMAKTTVDNTVSTILAPILQEVSNGVAIDVDPEMKAALGLRYDRIDINNISAVLEDTKMFLVNQSRKAYMDNFGQDAIPPDAWNKEVLSSIDGLIEVGKNFDTPQERAAVQKALIETKMYTQLDENGVAVLSMLSEKVPADTLNRMIGDMSAFDGAFAKAISGSGKVFTSGEIAKSVDSMSTVDAEKVANDAVTVLKHGIVPEFFTAFKEAQKRSGYNVVDGPTFEEVIGANALEIKKQTSENPTFRAELSDWLVSDINQTVSVLRSSLPDGARFVATGGGQYKIEMRSASRGMTDQEFTEATLAALPEEMNLKTLNRKLATLTVLGGVGREVGRAVQILLPSEEPEGFETKPATSNSGSPKVNPRLTTPAATGRGGSSSSSSSGNIGESLGIDFASMESEAGLPEGYLNKVAMLESGGNPNAKNPNSSAGGLFQQLDQNASAYGVADRFDPLQSTQGAVRFAAENKNYLAKVLGREPTGGELYLAHQQGPGGAAKLLSNPEALAVDVVGADAVRLNGGSDKMTAGEFANIWISKYNGSRGQTTGNFAAAPQSDQNISLNSSARDMPQGTSTASTASAEGLSVDSVTYDSPEVQQLIERVQASPEAAVQMAKEILAGRPVDPQIKALIEAIVKVGER